MSAKMKKFPKTPFKLDCGDKLEVRQWLHDNGCVWNDGDSLIEEKLEAKFLTVDSPKYVRWGEDINDFIDNTVGVFNPFKKKSKLEKRVEVLEERMATVDFTEQAHGVVDHTQELTDHRKEEFETGNL